jgi:hypothetical protein
MRYATTLFEAIQASLTATAKQATGEAAGRVKRGEFGGRDTYLGERGTF